MIQFYQHKFGTYFSADVNESIARLTADLARALLATLIDTLCCLALGALFPLGTYYNRSAGIKKNPKQIIFFSELMLMLMLCNFADIDTL